MIERIQVSLVCVLTKGPFTWGPKSQVSLMLASPKMKVKSQLLSLKILVKYG